MDVVCRGGNIKKAKLHCVRHRGYWPWFTAKLDCPIISMPSTYYFDRLSFHTTHGLPDQCMHPLKICLTHCVSWRRHASFHWSINISLIYNSKKHVIWVSFYRMAKYGPSYVHVGNCVGDCELIVILKLRQFWILIYFVPLKLCGTRNLQSHSKACSCADKSPPSLESIFFISL